MHLIDANVLITAKSSYYPIERIPEFWEWLVHMGETGALKIPLEIMEEMTGGTDNLAEWLRIREHKSALLLEEEVDISLVQRVISEGYASDLDDTELIEIGRDPFLVAYAMAAPHDRHVVTSEVSKPSCRRANRRIPDVCNHFGVRWCDSFTMVRTLDFSTAWRGRLSSRPDAGAPARRP